MLPDLPKKPFIKIRFEEALKEFNIPEAQIIEGIQQRKLAYYYDYHADTIWLDRDGLIVQSKVEKTPDSHSSPKSSKATRRSL